MFRHFIGIFEPVADVLALNIPVYRRMLERFRVQLALFSDVAESAASSEVHSFFKQIQLL